MRLARSVLVVLAACALTAVAACESMDTTAAVAPTDAPVAAAPAAPTGRRIPREVMTGGSSTVIQAVESDVPREEVVAVVQRLIEGATICTPLPTVWLAGEPRMGVFSVRYDLMRRDWGDESVQNARVRMDELVALGFLSAAETAPEVIAYTITREGRQYLRGAIVSGQRPAFCAPAERRLGEITQIDWGQFQCGTLRVRFTHVADNWPSWARPETTRARLLQTWPPLGQTGEGTVSLARQWFSLSALPRGVTNGALISACLDEEREEVIGNDLNLNAEPVAPE